MTNAQLNGYLELIARLIEAKAITPTEAADLVRQSKVSERKTKKEYDNMKLTELIYKMRENTMVFVTDDPISDEGIYFGAAGDMKVHFAAKYEVVEMYAEYYHAAYCCGITVIVKPSA